MATHTAGGIDAARWSSQDEAMQTSLETCASMANHATRTMMSSIEPFSIKYCGVKTLPMEGREK
jgi:hypothetical protein